SIHAPDKRDREKLQHLNHKWRIREAIRWSGSHARPVRQMTDRIAAVDGNNAVALGRPPSPRQLLSAHPPQAILGGPCVPLARTTEGGRSIEGGPVLLGGAVGRADILQRAGEREAERGPEFADGVRILGFGKAGL